MAMNIFRSELIQTYCQRPNDIYKGEVTDRDGVPAIVVQANQFYLSGVYTHFLNGNFKANTQYVINLYIDTDSVVYNSNNVEGGLVLHYTDGTSDSRFVFKGGNLGFVHKHLITTAGKTVDGFQVYYYTSAPVYIRYDSSVTEYSKVSIEKDGTFLTATGLEGHDKTSIGKGGVSFMNEIIEN